MMRRWDEKQVDYERPSKSTDAMCQRVLPSCPTSCLSWRESSYRVRVNRERDLLPQGSSELVLVAAENLLRQSHCVKCGCSTRGILFLDRVCSVYLPHCVVVASVPSPWQQDASRFAQRHTDVE